MLYEVSKIFKRPVTRKRQLSICLSSSNNKATCNENNTI